MALLFLRKIRLIQNQESICQRCVVSYFARHSFSVLNLDESSKNRANSAENSKTFSEYVETFKAALAVSYAGGGAKAIEKHTERQKMVVEDRVKALLDQDSPFLELSPLAGFQMEYGTIPRASMLTGI